jgi:hypothetical protein
MRIAMIEMTVRSSMSVNPAWVWDRRPRFFKCLDGVECDECRGNDSDKGDAFMGREFFKESYWTRSG